MNDPTHPVAATSPTYWEDSYGWALAQAELVGQRKLTEIDWDDLLDEIKEIARSQYRALGSALRVLLLHLLKWDVQPACRSHSWLLSIDEHGRRYRRILEDNPGYAKIWRRSGGTRMPPLQGLRRPRPGLTSENSPNSRSVGMRSTTRPSSRTIR